MRKLPKEGQSSKQLKNCYGKRKMKRAGFIYDKICEKENIRTAIIKASKDKGHYRVVKKVLDNIDVYIEKVQKILIDRKFKNTPYTQIQIVEKLSKKVRIISKPNFYPDQIVHWALMLQIQPIITRGLDPHCSGNIPGRGEKRIREYLRKIIPTDKKGTKYYLKYDVKQFYPSIDHERLNRKLARIIKDKDVLNLIAEIIKVTDKGIPIGTYTAQWLSNFYLQDLDHYTREKLGAKYMVRYVDDILILGPNKRKLFKMQKEIEKFLNSEGLTMKKSWIITALADRPIDMIGYKFYANGKVSIRRRIYKNTRRLILKIIHHGLNLKRARSFISYNGYVLNSNSYEIKLKYYHDLNLKEILNTISQGRQK